MVTETVEAPQAAPLTEEANLAPPEITQTETPATEVVAEGAVASPEEAVASAPGQLETPEAEKPLTRAEAEAFWKEREDKTREDERTREQGRRRTQAAREAAAAKREQEARAETMDMAKATLAVKLGLDASQIPDEAIDTAIVRAARRQAESLASSSLDTMDGAFDYIIAPLLGKEGEWDDAYTDTHKRVFPKMQAFYAAVYPKIEALAREGYIPETELPARVDAEIARRNAKAREGTEELKRPEGRPASGRTEAEILADPNTPVATLIEIRDRQRKGG